METKTFEEYKELLAHRENYDSWYKLMLNAGHNRLKLEKAAENLYNIYLRITQETADNILNKARNIIYE